MADYISRDIVLEIINTVNDTGGFAGYADYSVLFDEIDTMPAADVQPVRHGRWECIGHDDKTYWYRCSVCGHEVHDNMTKHDNYCSSCGARMEQED